MQTMTVRDYRDRCPNFFSRGNKEFFRDVSYHVWRGFLIVKGNKPIGRYRCSIYEPLHDDDVLHRGFAWDVEDAREKINEGQIKSRTEKGS